VASGAADGIGRPTRFAPIARSRLTSRLEVDLLDRDRTIECLRFHVLDAVDVGADGILAIGA